MITRLHNIPFVVFLIVILSTLIYTQSLFFDYTNFDDDVLIRDNYIFTQNIGNVFQAFRQDVFSPSQSSLYYRPLFTLMVMADAHMYGLSLWGYHLTNILLHICASICILFFFRRFFSQEVLASIGALLFAVHPALARAVAWLPARVEILLLVFSIGSIMMAGRYQERGLYRYGFLSTLFFIGALFTKETAIVLFPLLVLWMALVERVEWRRMPLGLYVAWGGGVGLWVWMRSSALSYENSLSLGSMIFSVLRNIPHLIWYIGQSLVPVHLSVFTIYRDATFFYGWIGIGILLICGWCLWRAHNEKDIKRALFGFIWFCAFLIPTFVASLDGRLVDMKEDRLYVALPGILLFALSAFNKPLKSSKNNFFIVAACLSCIAIFFIQAVLFTGYMRNTEVFWKRAQELSPTASLPYLNLGALMQERGDIDAAKSYYQKALELYPQETIVRYNLGLIAYEEGRYDWAERFWRDEVNLNPTYAPSYVSLAKLYLELGRHSDAQEIIRSGVEVQPAFPEWHDLQEKLENTQP